MVFDCEFAIVGAGVAGLTTAIALTGLKKDFLVFEQAPVLKGIGAGFGLAANAMQAFDYLGLRQEVEGIGFYTDTYEVLDHKGRVLIAPDAQSLSDRYSQKNLTVHRADLHQYLQGKLNPQFIQLGKRLNRFERVGDAIVLRFEDGTTYCCRYLIVADGVNSTARQQLVPCSKPRYSGYTCWRATIPNGVIGLQRGSETWGGNGRFGMTPLVHDRIYWYACINAPRNDDAYKNYTVQDLLRSFGGYHNPIPEILSNTKDEDLLWNDIIDIKPLSQFAYNNILLIGDAAHATTPNMGQGACQALEDVAVLADELKRGGTVTGAFKRFEKRRLKRTKYITDTSWRIGRAAQYTHPLMIGIRNSLLRVMPTAWTQATLKKLLDVDFMAV